jgi:HAMP domain-containing protein
MWELLQQWTLAVAIGAVCYLMVWALVKMDNRRLAEMTEEERYQEWIDMQW